MKKYIYFLYAFLCMVGLTACSESDDTTLPLASDIQAYGKTALTRSIVDESYPLVFSGDHIEWFDPTTGEIKFKGLNPGTSIFPFYTQIEFRKRDTVLFTASSFVTDVNSQSYYDLVIYYNVAENRYYLNDCYPDIASIRDSEEVARHKKEREPQWEIFLNTLKTENRLKN